MWLIDQGHEGWQYNNHLPWRRMLPLFLPVGPFVCHQPVSRACIRDLKGSLSLNFSSLKGLICQSCDIQCFPLGELPASDLPFSGRHTCLLVHLRPWNAVQQHPVSQANMCQQQRGKTKLVLTSFLKTCNLAHPWWSCVWLVVNHFLLL